MLRKTISIIAATMICIAVSAQSRDARYVETYTQYLPALADLGLGLAGVDSREGIAGRTIELGIGYATQVIVVNAILKNVVREERPDGSAFNSFPSGHTATAFTGAEFIRIEYGWGWGAGAYALATSVAAMRVYHQRHYWWDTVAGAGLGILSANVGHWMLKPAKRLFGMPMPEMEMSLAPSTDPISGTPIACFRLSF